MIEYVPIDLGIHKSLLIDLNDEYLSWIANEVKNNYDINLVSILRQSIRDYAKKSVEELTSYKPPKGVFYILKIKDKEVGMGAFRKLKMDIGEVKRMYIRSNYRGKGFGKALLKQLLNKGKEFGCSKILLDTGQFMTAAQHVDQFGKWYKSRHLLFSEAIPIEYTGEIVPGINLDDKNYGIIGSIYGDDKIIHLINFSDAKGPISLEFSSDYWNNISKVKLEPNIMKLKLMKSPKGIKILIPQESVDPVDTILRITQ